MNVNKNGADAAALAENLVLNPASFYQLHELELRKLWALKLLDASAYILFIVRVHSAAGWKWSFKIKDFCKAWNISKTAFYRAVSKLKVHGLLHWETGENITVWHGTEIAQTSPHKETILWLQNSPPRGTEIPATGTKIPPTGTGFPIAGLKKSETVAQSESRNAPDSFQIFLDPTDNWAVAGEKELEEEKEVDEATDGVAKPPVIENHCTQLQAFEEATQIEPTIPNRDNSPAKSLNTDKVLNLDNSPAKSLNTDKALEDEEIENKIEPTTEEVREILQHLRAVGIALNSTIRATVKKHYLAVNDALAHLKERISQGERFRNLEGAFVKACWEGARPENKSSLGGVPEEINPPSVEQLAALETAKASGKIRDYFLSTDGVCKVVMPNLHTQMAWWEYLTFAKSASAQE